ncbi:MAG: glycosyltransferase family 25 protein [Ferruginibacter sp.]|nr:glycosyltransferase family 25 protein [Ferruginibacter sp.]
MAIPSNISKRLDQYFDKIFIVSVPRFVDRHERVKQNLEGLSFDFFWGADKLELNYDTAKADGTYDEQKAKKLQRQGKVLNLGEIACSLSHRMIYEAIIKNGWERVLILEDDVLPLEENLQQLPVTLDELPADWELVYLGYLKHEKVTAGLKIKQLFYKIQSALGLMAWTYKMVSNLLPKPFSAHLKKAGFHDCTHAYAVTLSGAKKLVGPQTPVVYRADDLLSATIMKGELNAFVTKPKFFDQEIFHNAAIASEIKT